MKRLHDLLPAPAWMLPRLSRNAAEKTWMCQTCGVVPPIALADGWFARRLCRCERAAFDARQLHQLQEEQRQVRTALTYTWLGRAWSEPGLAAKTFATFRGERQPDAYELAQAFAAETVGTLALYGSYGSGKTHLLAAIANAVASSGRICRFASVVSLFDALQERIQIGQDYHELLRKAIEAPLLVLDDLDKLKPSEFREETLYKLLNGRCNAGLPLAISSNNAPNDLERWVGSAGRSRLMQGLIPVPMNGPDYRLEVEI
ncbi:MAG: DnaA ATPase domain-containing protein [Ktedonobacteraceae bacterium]